MDGFTREIIRVAMKVHSSLGPGLFEEVYKVCLRYELEKLGFDVKSEVSIPLYYDGIKFDIGYRIDLLIDNSLVLELKSVQQILPVHKAQLITYLKLSNKELGLLINFNSIHLKNGIRRVINTKATLRP